MRPVGGTRVSGRQTDVGSEGGWALMETIFAAALLIVIALAVFSSMDVASKTSAATKGRTVASQLAEQDQERMRGMTVDQLSGYSASNNVTVAGVSYHIESQAEWWGDSLGAPLSCATNSKANYLRISSTVTSNVVGKDTQPVTVRGLVAPPVGANSTRGTLAIKVTDRNGDPVANIPVALSGSASLSATTNALGCAVFAYIPAGNGTAYTATLNSTGYVDDDDNQLSKVSPNVTPGDVTIQPMTYDVAGKITVDLRDSANQAPNPVPANVSVNQSKWFTPLPTRRVPPSTISNLFPFPTSAYTVYAGSCDGANPALSPPYSNQGASAGSAIVQPGQTMTGVVVRVPTVTVNLRDNSNNPTSGTVSLTPTGTGCGADATGARSVGASGTIALDVPYGTYTVCGQVGTRVNKTVTVNNYDVNGNTATVKVTNTSLSGSCP
jgi:hypothetical protein